MGEVELRKYLNDRGYGRDTGVSGDLLDDMDVEETSRTSVTKIYPDAKSYRDDRRFSSIHITDYRGVDREDMESDIVVAHLEHFNPEYHPVLHALIDTPLWFIRNRLIRKSDL